MEREYTIGALLILITIFVMVLIVYFTVPGFSDSISQIADEVFGISKKLAGQQAEEIQRKKAVAAFDSVINCINSCKGSEKTCTCYLEDKELSEGYILKARPKEEEGHIFVILEEDNLRVKGTDEKRIEDVKFCILKDLNTPEYIPWFNIRLEKDKVILEYGKKKYNFIDHTPEFYSLKKDDQKHICFVVKEKIKDEDVKKKIRGFNDCKEPEKNVARDRMIKFFNDFVKKYELCKTYKDKQYCLCDSIDFKELYYGYDISATQEGKTTTFSLHYAEDQMPRPIGDPKKVENNLFGLDDVNLKEKERKFLKEWQEKGRFAKYTPYIFKSKDENVYLNSNIAQPLERDRCSPFDILPKWYLDGKEKKCSRKLDTEEIWERIETTVSSGKTYKEIIEASTEDQHLRLLAAAVMATESEAINTRPSETGCKGLMQFCAGTARYFDVPCDGKTCYVCKPKDPNSKNSCYIDNREKPYIAVPAGIKLIQDKTKVFENKGYTTSREIYGLAAYNGGEGVVLDAVKATKKSDPDWETVKKYITRDILIQHDTYKEWNTERLNAKIEEISCYPYYVQEFMKSFEEKWAS